ncbi:hypothetical protein SeMB42_g02276 [Synchytrium endobioticum]|uniref:RWD domain-containing protein n=1 Tax=Synchytrium endobioticum TaxID=286115 RepID=A0A507CUU6_9FUNG|nr:hypothetical protein SeLEV6574_g05339 [Synchytrium endobioticum]TPX50380.1 hypothetical protein SeMB42_g02276 [Synchytrium endobioticum]
MSNYEEERRNELEALQSIYPDEFEAISATSFSIIIKSDDSPDVSFKLLIEYTPTYPDEAPTISITEEEGITESESSQLLSLAETEAANNLGMVSVFTIITSTKECLETLLKDRIEREEAENDRIRIAEEEAEAARYAGSKVTHETFVTWWATFIVEKQQEEMRIAKEKGIQLDKNKGKLTGRQLFEKDKALAASDVKMAGTSGADDEVVDLSLFEEGLEDLDDEDDDNAVLAGIRAGVADD